VSATVKDGTATATDVRDLTLLKEHRKGFGRRPGGPGAPAPDGTPASPSTFDGSGSAQPA
jgi:hypothetical protein